MRALQTQCGIELTPTQVAQAVWKSDAGAEVPQPMEPSGEQGS